MESAIQCCLLVLYVDIHVGHIVSTTARTAVREWTVNLMHRGNFISDEVAREIRTVARCEQMKEKKDKIRIDVYNMSKNELRKELLKYKYNELEGCLLLGGLLGLEDY